ncbi:oxidoreductase FAD-binding protein [Venturia nashicola]|uniref:Oxidoreductase FAD-binding protein n=1 Tax=Venturia nashicola TaxID=86259 RepID=A0A4Z1NCR4_9PEZI|nr:oxidoreductase FAD-binding protein [Venturia nashicola]
MDLSSCLIYLLALGSLVSAASNPCCEALAASFPDKVVDSGSTYRAIKASYWADQAGAVSPSCFLQPANGGDVSVAVKILTQPQFRDLPACRFAVRSGGHTGWAGASSIEGGVTIDLSNMKEVLVSADKRMVTLGPGNRWGEVYPQLEDQGVAVSGGRWGNVGVGGLLTGGGLSFFQGTEGLACDGVLNHEVVLADGTIVNANPQENADLHRALKGGSNNFGIVTRFYVKAFPHTDIWGGRIVAGGRQTQSVEWFQNFANSSASDWDPHGMTMFALGSFMGVSGGGSLATYSKPQSDAPAIFQPFHRTSLSATTGQTTISNVSATNAAIAEAGGRVLWATMTHANSAPFMEELMAFAKEKGSEMPTLSSGIQLLFQPLWHTSRARSFTQTGGNSLGLEASNDDLVIVLATTKWSSSTSDEVVNGVMKEFIDEAQGMAKRDGVFSRYIYTNYAAGWQDPMRGYGEGSLGFLREVSRKYDPGQVFQRQVPGGFKLERVLREEVRSGGSQ